MAFSCISKPTNFLETPSSFCFKRNSLSTNSLSNLVIQPNPASNGEVVSSISFPYKQKPFSSLKVSLEANPQGISPNSSPAFVNSSQSFSAFSFPK